MVRIVIAGKLAERIGGRDDDRGAGRRDELARRVDPDDRHTDEQGHRGRSRQRHRAVVHLPDAATERDRARRPPARSRALRAARTRRRCRRGCRRHPARAGRPRSARRRGPPPRRRPDGRARRATSRGRVPTTRIRLSGLASPRRYVPGLPRSGRRRGWMRAPRVPAARPRSSTPSRPSARTDPSRTSRGAPASSSAARSMSPARPPDRIDVGDPSHEDRTSARRAILAATDPAPRPSSIPTTASPSAHDTSIALSAVWPPCADP